MTQPGEPGYPGTEEGTPVMTDLSNPEQHDSAAAVPAAGGGHVDESRITELVDELEKIRADAAKGIKAVLRITPPHSSFTYGGVTVTDQPTTVAAVHVPGLQEAAANSGVTLVQET